VTAAEDPIGNDIGVNHDNGVKPLVIGDDYGGSKSVTPINNDNGVGTPAWSKPINKYNGGSTKPIGSSPKPNQVNNDNVAKGCQCQADFGQALWRRQRHCQQDQHCQ
jgi:hypothetical protein